MYPGIAALLPTVGAVLVIVAGCALPTDGCGRLLGLPLMQATGRISYSRYLWHWPVLVFAPLVVGHPLGLTGRTLAALLAAGLAVLTLRFLENPLRFAPRLRNSPWRSLGLGALATAIAVCVGLGLLKVVVATTPVGHGGMAAPLAVSTAPVPPDASPAVYTAAVRQAFAQVQAAVAASVDVQRVPSNLDPPLAEAAAAQQGPLPGGCLRGDKEGGQPECTTGDLASATTVALVGDSHAAQWNPAFQRVADQRHRRLQTMAKEGCPLVDVPIAKHLPGLVESIRHCEQWRAEILARLRAEHPQLVVLSVWRGYVSDSNFQIGFTPFDKAWEDSLTRLVGQLRDTGAQVMVLGPVPNPGSFVPNCLAANMDDGSACSPSRSAAVNQRGIAAEAAATTAGGGHYVDLTDLFCTTDQCPVIIGNSLVYFDTSHLTLQYSRALAPVMGPLADSALANN
ncbi:hypothetical protein MSAR_29510 [Mycolicibacterium sarraceniae]|uniref:SGNH domain-containing protein n=1 Tax=Mycolicibacterium sarraceniae TaxID=1534348 RepID=A0A7I7SUT7_9MYCO|nr:hypothetical protein MSAR_29510 [Mycolicibacterium sarraceniae]